MASFSGPPPGLERPKTSKSSPKPPSTLSPRVSPAPPIVSPNPRRPQGVSWASSLAAGLFPPSFELPFPPQVPQGLLPFDEAVHPVGRLPQPPQVLTDNKTVTAFTDNILITDLASSLTVPLLTDPWHRAHARNCTHATAACAACSISLTCCSCRSLRFTPGPAPVSPVAPSTRRSRSASPALFRTDVGNGTPPPGFDSHVDEYDDDAYTRALADSDTCDNSSCPNGPDYWIAKVT